MQNLSLSLRKKILFGSFFLVVPLGLALTFVYLFGSSGIETAQREQRGVAATAPLWEAVFSWQHQGTDTLGPLKAFQEYLETGGQDLVPAADATTGATWQEPNELASDLASAAADPQGFGAFHKKLMNDLLILADTSGLVLDPDLDSHYLTVAVYQTIPNLLAALTDLEPLFHGEPTRLANADRLLLSSRAETLRSQAAYLKDQVSRSTRSGSPAFADQDRQALQALADSAVETANAFETAAAGPALGDGFDPQVFSAQRYSLLGTLAGFQTQGCRVVVKLLDARMARLGASLWTAFASALLGVFVGGLVLLLVVSGIRRRAFGLVGSLAAVARGDLSREVPAGLLKSTDELGRIARSVETLHHDLRTQVMGIEAVLVDLSQIGSNLSSTVEESSASIEQMSAITASVARASQAQSDQTDQAQRVVSEMVARIIQSNDLTQGMATQFFLFSQSMEANRTRISQTSAAARATGERADGLQTTGEAGARSLENLRGSIQGVVEKTKEIEEIVRFILDIADRTNLLSMNAAIEAARAGSSGRGFSVVADEIRKLAVSSSQQAQNIRGLLEGISTTVNKTLEDSQTTAQAFDTLKQDIAAVRDASRDIAEKMAAQEAEDEQLSSGLHQFAQFYAQLSEVLDVQTAESQQILGVLGSLSDAGREISNSMAEQKIGMEQSSEASVVVRDTTMTLGQVIQVLEVQVGRFKT